MRVNTLNASGLRMLSLCFRQPADREATWSKQRRPGSALLRPCCLPSVHTQMQSSMQRMPSASRICKSMHPDFTRMPRKPSKKRICKSMHPELRRSLRCREYLRKTYLRVDASRVSGLQDHFHIYRSLPAADLLLIEVWGSRSVAGS